MEYPLIFSTLLASALSSFCVFGVAQTASGTTDLETAFKTSFDKFRQSIIAKDTEQLKAAMAASSYMKMKNQGIAYKMDFPKDFFEGMGGKLYTSLDLSKVETLKVLENKNTGMLVALAPKSAKFDPFEMGEDAQAMLITFSFIKEAGVWKFSEAPMEPLKEDEGAKLLKLDLTKLDDDRYKPSGVVPPAQAEEAAPDYDYDAVLNINSFGYEVEVILNGKALRKTQGNSAQRTGVKKGDNTIVIKSVAMDGAYDFKVTISASKGEQAPIEVFNLKVGKPEPVITKTFLVNLE